MVVKKVAAGHSATGHTTNNQQRRMTLLDQPMLDNGRFDMLTVSAAKQAKSKKQSVLVQGVNDFAFDSFV